MELQHLCELFVSNQFIEYDKAVTDYAKKEKITVSAVKKQISFIVDKQKRKREVLELPYNIPTGFFIENNAIWKETKDSDIFISDYCIVSEIHRTNDNEESVFTILFPFTSRVLSFDSNEFVDNKIFETKLLNYGIFLGEKIKDFKNYINGFMHENRNSITTTVLTSKTGWQEVYNVDIEGKIKRSTIYCNPIINPKLSYVEAIEKKITQKGDLTTSLEILNMGLKYKGSCITILSSLASTLIKPLSEKGLSNFVINLAGVTGEGKTLSSRIGLSMFGNATEDSENSLINNMNATVVGNEIHFKTFSDMPILLDEAGTIKGTPEKKAQFIIDLIFQFFSGQGRTRSQKNLKLRAEQNNRGVLILTMESDLKTIEKMSSSQEKGYFRRTIEVFTDSGNFLPSKEVYNFSNINENYGFVSQIFVNKIVKDYKEIVSDYLKFEKELTLSELRGKEKYFAVLHTTLEQLKRLKLIKISSYDEAKKILDLVYKENLEIMQDITVNRLQNWAESLQEWIAMNYINFSREAKIKYGIIIKDSEFNDSKIFIYPKILDEFLMENGINKRTFQKEMHENGALTVAEEAGKVRYTLKRDNVRVYVFNLIKIEELTSAKGVVFEAETLQQLIEIMQNNVEAESVF